MSHILIINNNRSHVLLTRKLCSELAHTSKTLIKPQTLLTALERESFDLILMQMMGTETEEFALFKTLKEHQLFHTLPVLVLTSETEDSFLGELLEYDTTDYVPQPFGKRVLSTKIKRLLEKAHYEQRCQNQLSRSNTQLRKEHAKCVELDHKVFKLQKEMAQWQALPPEIHEAMADVLMKFVHDVDELDEDLKQTILTATYRYGNTLSKFINISTERDPEALEIRKNRVTLLNNQPLFQGLSAFELITLTEQMEELVIEPDTNLLTQNQPAERVFFIEQGTVEILVNDELVAHRKEGDSFGEMSCLRGEVNASATVRALTTCRILAIQRDRFLEIVNRLPQLWQNVFRDTTNRFNDVNQRLSELFQHTTQGLLKIDKDSNITNEFSTQCTKILGTRDLTGKSLAPLLFYGSREIQVGWQHTYPLFFEDTLLSFEDLVELMPNETSFKNSEGLLQEYRLSFYPCWDKAKRLVAIDIGIDDISEERKFSREREALKQEKEIIQKIYDDPNSYLQMLQLSTDTHNAIEEYQSCLKAPALPHNLSEMTIELMRSLHTLKGISGLFRLNGLKTCVHELEDCLRYIKETHRVTSDMASDIQNKKQLLEKELRYAQSLIENIDEGLRKRLLGIVFEPEEFFALKQAVLQNELEQAKNLLLKAEKVPVRRLVQHWPKEINRLSQQLGKQVKFKIEGDNLLISQELFQTLEAPLVHILRNCMDHGLEPPEERIYAKKDEWGKITVKITQAENNLVLEISDDGRGLNLSKIAEKAKANVHLDQRQINHLIELRQTWKILLLPGFSTAEKVTDVSGRGVGLDAVQAAITKIGGKIEVQSEIGEGTSFSFWIPL
ncbi:ATP-binding protein [Deltaproteobacteria bacterium TL4]